MENEKEHLVSELARTHERVAELEAELQARHQDLDDIARYVISEFKSPLGMIVGFSELLEQEHAALSEEELRHCIRMINQSGRKISKMINAVLLLANSRRLFDNVWYSAYLTAMEETSLLDWVREKGIAEVYRFTCLPASSAPLIVRVWRTEDEASHCQAIAKLGNSQPADYDDETEPISPQAEWTLTKEEWNNLVAAIEASEFWSESSSLEQLGWLRMVGTGGEEWIFEGWRQGQHRIRTVWNPDEKKTHAAYTLGKSFAKSLPDWFALEMAQLWTADAQSEIYPRFEDAINLSSLL